MVKIVKLYNVIAFMVILLKKQFIKKIVKISQQFLVLKKLKIGSVFKQT